MADLRTSLKDKPIDRDERALRKAIRRTVNLADLAVGDNEILDIPAESALVRVTIISRVSAASSGSGTLAVKFNSIELIGDDASDLLVVAELAKGKVVEGPAWGDPAETVETVNLGKALYVTADTELIFDVKTAVYQSGQVDIVAEYISVLDNT